MIPIPVQGPDLGSWSWVPIQGPKSLTWVPVLVQGLSLGSQSWSRALI